MEWTVSLTPLPPYRWGKNSPTYLIAGWVGPKGCLEVLGKVNLFSLSGFEPRIVVNVVTTISQPLIIIIIIIIINKKLCNPVSKGCKNQLMISEAMYEYCKRINNLRVAWIDCQKTSDSVPHSSVEKSIEVVEINSKFVTFSKSSMEIWNTGLQLKAKQEVMQSQPILIRRAIFQGDSLSFSSLLFV